MKTLSIQDIKSQINYIENMILMLNLAIDNQDDQITKMKNLLPEVREKAYPKDKSETTDMDKDFFKRFIENLGNTKKLQRKAEASVVTLNKRVSALNYILYNKSEAKKFNNEGFKVIVLDLLNITDNTIPFAAIGAEEQGNSILVSEMNLEDLQDNINMADKVVTFAREDAIEHLNDLGIEVSVDNRKFTSIHHLMRAYTNFQREGLKTYADILEYELFNGNEDNSSNTKGDNSYNLMRVYTGIVGIETSFDISERDDLIIQAQIDSIKSMQPMFNELEKLAAEVSKETLSNIDKVIKEIL